MIFNKSFNFAVLVAGAFLLIFFQTIFLPVNFLLLFVLFLSLVNESESFFFWVFLLGLVFDLVGGRRIGLSSLALLVIVFCVFLYRRKISTFHFLFVPIASFFSSLFFDVATLGLVRIKPALTLAISSLILGLFFQLFGFLKQRKKGQLSLD